MNWQYLRYFEVVAREEHLTRAAEKLHMTQSALSKSIDNLEKELGFPLFEQRGRNIRLTKYGHIFYNHVASATKEIETGLETIHEAICSSKGIVRLASIFSLGAFFIPDIIKGFQLHNPDIRLMFYQTSTSNILYDVLNGEVDLGFCGEFVRDGDFKELDAEVVQVEELLLVVPPEHRLANQDSVEFQDLLDENFVGYTDNTGIIHSIRDTLKRAGLDGIRLKENYQVAEDNTIVGMVRAGLGIAFVADCPYIQRQGVSFLHIRNPYFCRKLYLVWKKDGFLSQAAKAFKYYVLSQTHP